MFTLKLNYYKSVVVYNVRGRVILQDGDSHLILINQPTIYLLILRQRIIITCVSV